MPIDFERAERLPAGAERFFKTFSRLEFALKDCGHLPKADGRAYADWHSFAAALGPTFFEEAVASGAATTLLQRPPKKQVVRSGSLDFEDVRPAVNAQELLDTVCRVRNNLFHGGKSGDPDASPDDPRRNEKLIAESQWVLEQALSRADCVRYAFEGRY